MERLLYILIILIFISCQKSQRYEGPIIDVHMHSFSFDRYGNPPPPNPITNALPKDTSNIEVIKSTIGEMNRLKIEASIISGPIENVLEWKGVNPEKFIGGLYYHPRTPLPELDKFKTEHQKGNIEVLGELGLGYGGLSPADSSLYKYFEYAEDNNIPVGIHMALGEPNLAINWAERFRVKYVNPLLIEELVLRYPKLKIYLMHAGWPFLEQTKAILCMFANVYADLSVINWILPDTEFQSYLNGLMKMDGVECNIPQKLMYGSDQMIWIDAIELSIENIQKMESLTLEQKSDIFYNNAVRFFGKEKFCKQQSEERQ